MSQRDDKPPLLFVKFEQARGRSGVPKTWVPFFAGRPGSPETKPELSTLVRQAVDSFRAQCEDANLAHGEDWMPGAGAEDYSLHATDGEQLGSVDEIRWEDADGWRRAELVLTWKDPAILLREVTAGASHTTTASSYS